MILKCIVCGKETIVAGQKNHVTSGICFTGDCGKEWNDWMDMPSPKPELHQYHFTLSLKKRGGKFP